MYIYIYIHMYMMYMMYVYIYIYARNVHSIPGNMNFIKLHFYHPKMGCSGFDVCRGLTVLQPCFQGFLFSQNAAVWWTQLGKVSGTDGQDDSLRRRLALALARALHDGSLSSHLDKATVLKKTTQEVSFVQRNGADPFKLPDTVSPTQKRTIGRKEWNSS